jgi:hypothetical protein
MVCTNGQYIHSPIHTPSVVTTNSTKWNINIKNGLNLHYYCDTWACICSAREHWVPFLKRPIKSLTVKKPAHAYIWAINAKKHDWQLKLLGSNYCVQLSYTAVQPTEVANFWSVTDFNGEGFSTISKECNMATKVTELILIFSENIPFISNTRELRKKKRKIIN